MTAGARTQQGSALIEALVSVLLFSIAIIALMRVLGSAVKESGDIEYRAVAATVADETIGRMWVDRANLAAYVETDAALPAGTGLPSGTRTVAVIGNLVSVTINWQAPGAGAHTHTVSATLASN